VETAICNAVRAGAENVVSFAGFPSVPYYTAMNADQFLKNGK
jgi:hypothetical protein